MTESHPGGDLFFYVDDTLLLIKPDTIDLILDYFHKFDKNIRFKYDLFENTTPHGIYRKELKKITSWNGFPSRISHALIRRFSSNALNKNQTTANNSKDKDEPVTIWLSIPYIGEKTSQLLRSFKRKLRRHLKNPNTQIRIREKTTKLCFYTNNKDKVPLLNKSHVVYKFSCPGCQSSYIGKTDRTLLTRAREHAVTDKESVIYKHLRTCEHLAFIHNLLNLADTLNNITAPLSIKHRLRTTDYGLGIKHELRYKTRTKHYGLGIKYGLGYKTRTERYGLGLNTKRGSTLNKFSHERLHNKNRSYL